MHDRVVNQAGDDGVPEHVWMKAVCLEMRRPLSQPGVGVDHDHVAPELPRDGVDRAVEPTHVLVGGHETRVDDERVIGRESRLIDEHDQRRPR